MDRISLKIFLILAVVLAGGFAAFSLTQNSSVPPFGGKTYEVNLGEDGFSPKEIVLKAGDAVKFTTTKDEFFWPASNLHPTHEIYPEFDPRKPIGPNESWTFIFSKAGQWRYHNHLSPGFTGLIKVE